MYEEYIYLIISQFYGKFCNAKKFDQKTSYYNYLHFFVDKPGILIVHNAVISFLLPIIQILISFDYLSI